MEGQDGYNERKLLTLKFSGDGNDAPLTPQDDTNHHYLMATGKTGKQISNSYLPQPWVQTGKQSPNYVEFLDEGSMFITNAPMVDMLESIPANSTQAVNGVFEIHGEISYNYTGNSRPTDSSTCVEAGKSCIPWMQDCNGDNSAAATPSSWPKRKTSLTDRLRRLRIADRLTALQELLPQPAKGSQASALDDVIDHIKYLQLQIKDLSQSKLCGESTSEPFIFLEGYGHYISNQQMLNEPLEEMMGKLLEVNPLAAAQLLNSKGLYLMPLDLAQGFW